MTNEFSVSTAAATAIVGYNLIKDEKWKSATYARKISGFSLVGSAAIADTQVELWVGEARKGTFWNTSAGASIAPKKEILVSQIVWFPQTQRFKLKSLTLPRQILSFVLSLSIPLEKKKTFSKGGIGSRIRNPAAYNAAVARNRAMGR